MKLGHLTSLNVFLCPNLRSSNVEWQNVRTANTSTYSSAEVHGPKHFVLWKANKPSNCVEIPQNLHIHWKKLNKAHISTCVPHKVHEGDSGAWHYSGSGGRDCPHTGRQLHEPAEYVRLSLCGTISGESAEMGKESVPYQWGCGGMYIFYSVMVNNAHMHILSEVHCQHYCNKNFSTVHT